MDEEEIIIANAIFDAPADNYEDFDQELDPAKLGEKLIQTNTLKGTVREYQYYSNNYLFLNLVKKKKSEEKKFRVNLSWLSSEPEHIKIIIWKWLYGALASTALMSLFIFLTYNGTLEMTFGAVLSTASLTAALILFLIFIYQMRNEYIFKSYFGGANLFVIENKKPEQAVFDKFFITLQQAIDRSKTGIPVSDQLIGELKMCRRLRDESIIDDETYTMARTAIFKHKQYKA
jgi:hypothetical protein